MARYLLDTNMLVNIFENDYIHKDIQHILSDSSNVFYTCSECVKELIHLVQKPKKYLLSAAIQVSANTSLLV